MRIEWNKVTWYSQLLAIVLFVAVLWLGFRLGRDYQRGLDRLNAFPTDTAVRTR